MVKERQEHFLYYFLAVVQGQSRRVCVAKERIPELREQVNDFVFQGRWSGYKHPELRSFT
jgi:hypothetical protein